jgi:hypothetical protein
MKKRIVIEIDADEKTLNDTALQIKQHTAGLYLAEAMRSFQIMEEKLPGEVPEVPSFLRKTLAEAANG